MAPKTHRNKVYSGEIKLPDDELLDWMIGHKEVQGFPKLFRELVYEARGNYEENPPKQAKIFEDKRYGKHLQNTLTDFIANKLESGSVNIDWVNREEKIFQVKNYSGLSCEWIEGELRRTTCSDYHMKRMFTRAVDNKLLIKIEANIYQFMFSY